MTTNSDDIKAETPVDNHGNESDATKNQFVNIQKLISLKQIIANLTNENIDSSVEQTMKLYDSDLPYSFNMVISILIYYTFLSRKTVTEIYVKYIKSLQAKEEEQNKTDDKIVNILSNYILQFNTQEAYYLLVKMIEYNLIDKDFVKDIDSKYFGHYRTDEENRIEDDEGINEYFLNNYDNLSKNDFELHKKLLNKGINPSELSKIIRNDDIGKLQVMSGQQNFDIDQEIAPSLYEKNSYVNKEGISLINYAAYFGSPKCFKYLMDKGAKLINTSKYASAGGNLEIIKLCEQRRLLFKSSYKASIRFHRNEVFQYLYTKKLERIFEKKEKPKTSTSNSTTTTSNMNNNNNRNNNNINGMNNMNGPYGMNNMNDPFGNNNNNNNRNRFGNGPNQHQMQYDSNDEELVVTEIEENINNDTTINDLLTFCINYGNFEMLLYVIKDKSITQFDDSIINETAKIGNIYLIKDFIKGHEIPKDTLIYSSESKSNELVKYVIDQKGIDINAQNI
ncbi:cask-interacting protein (caskin) 1,2 [Histomonas meleagridis]|uniref:cask-interacting protein (caskin) n=1 Tax=Histomonas meleagridis TaxID=135588 RepID=UPI00355A7481|nr:cask-interacting protein (caskin) 1,2 [Histomonas meleagridis]KAH0796660.1 cask-interacting protein (caskin) [Histomonas meleagridis]